jgi:short-subunit dehydrogenase
LAKEVETKKGKLDVLFANAGIAEPKPTAAVSAEDYDKTFAINTFGVFFAVQKALPLMKDCGSIILTGSGIWQKGIPIYPTYGATKAALRSFVRPWTADLAGKGIRANVISPGPVEAPILKGQFGENTDAMKEQFKTMIPMGRIGKPEEIASAAVFLASDESSYISCRLTGITLLSRNTSRAPTYSDFTYAITSLICPASSTSLNGGICWSPFSIHAFRLSSEILFPFTLNVPRFESPFSPGPIFFCSLLS